MASREMKHLFNLGRYKFYWAGDQHLYKGLWVWNGTNNVRIIALNHFKNWTGKEPIS